MHTLLQIFQIVLGIALTILVLVQSKSGGFSSGIASSFSMYRSRRGLEKVVFIITILSGSLLVINSILLLVIN